jgi:hypothetical protein
MNWDEHFRNVTRRTLQPATFGSFLGVASEKTIADLRQLIKAKDDELAQIEKHIQSTPGIIDPDFVKDWANLKARYRAVRDPAQLAIDKGTGGFLGSGINRFMEGFTTAKQYYDAILKSLQQSYPDLRVTKGDAQDIFNRLPFAIKSLPQPGNPPSSQLYQGLDATAKYAVPDPVKAAVAWTTPNLVPQTTDKPSYDKAEDKIKDMGSWLTKNLTLVAVGLGATAVVVIAAKGGVSK